MTLPFPQAILFADKMRSSLRVSLSATAGFRRIHTSAPINNATPPPTLEDLKRLLDASNAKLVARLEALHNGWFRSNERTIYASLGAGLAALAYSNHSKMERKDAEMRLIIQMKDAEIRSLDRWQRVEVVAEKAGAVAGATRNLPAGTMSRDVHAERAKLNAQCSTPADGGDTKPLR